MNYLKPRYRGTKSYALVYLRLVSAAIKKEYVTYDEIAHIVFEKPIKGSGMAGKIGYILGEINQNELIYNRPLLTSIVINRNNNPGSGYFDFAAAVGKLSEDATEEAKSAFHKRELENVYSTWQDFVASKIILSL